MIKPIFRALLTWMMRYEALLRVQFDKFELEQLRQRLEHLKWRHQTLDQYQASKLEHFDIEQKIKRDNFLAQQQIERLMLHREVASVSHRVVTLDRQIDSLIDKVTS